MLYAMLVAFAAFAGFVLGFITARTITPSQLKTETSTNTELKAVDFLMRLGAGDVGNPELEARVLLQDIAHARKADNQ